jgi:Mrp family chromosome partitioning ATPase
MIHRLRCLLQRRWRAVRGAAMAGFGLGFLAVLVGGASCLGTATLVVAHPPPGADAGLAESFAVLVSRYLERFRDPVAVSTWLTGRGIAFDPLQIQSQLEVLPEMQDGCRFQVRLRGASPWQVRRVLEAYTAWVREESARLRQDHVRDLQRFYARRRAELQAEKARYAAALAALHAELRCPDLPSALARLETRRLQLQKELTRQDQLRRRLMDRLAALARPAPAPAGRSSTKRTTASAPRRASREVAALRSSLEADLRRVQARQIAVRSALAEVDKSLLLLQEKREDYEEIQQNLLRREQALDHWYRQSNLAALVGETGLGAITLAAGPTLETTGLTFQRWETWLGLVALSWLAGLGGALVGEMRDRTVRAPFLLPLGRGVAIEGRVVEVDPALLRESEVEIGDPVLESLVGHPSLVDLGRRVLAAYERQPFRTLALLSPVPDSGTSTVSAALAIHLARAGRNVLLIDADLRRPAHRLRFWLPARPGLTAWRPGRALADLTAAVGIPGLRVLPTGALPPDPARFWNEPGWVRAWLDEARSLADLVLVDLPPLRQELGIGRLFACLDRLILVAGVGRTPLAEVQAACEVLRAEEREPAGLVYTRIPPEEFPGGWQPA